MSPPRRHCRGAPRRQSHLALSPRATLTLPRDTIKQLGRPIATRAAAQQPAVGADPRYAGPLDHRRRAVRRRAGGIPAADGALGNASSFVAVRYSRHGEDFLQRAQALQDAGALDHLTFSGVDLARQLLGQSRRPGAAGDPDQLLGWETLPAEAPVRFHDGLTQTPQVAIDIRLDAGQRKTCSCVWTTPSRRCTVNR